MFLVKSLSWVYVELKEVLLPLTVPFDKSLMTLAENILLLLLLSLFLHVSHRTGEDYPVFLHSLSQKQNIYRKVKSEPLRLWFL